MGGNRAGQKGRATRTSVFLEGCFPFISCPALRWEVCASGSPAWRPVLKPRMRSVTLWLLFLLEVKPSSIQVERYWLGVLLSSSQPAPQPEVLVRGEGKGQEKHLETEDGEGHSSHRG